MTHASLFSGIGGFDLAADLMGWRNVFNCEWEEFPRKVLKYHFPNTKQYGDIRQFHATAYAGRIDILSGGFPCQPYSVAGKRKGQEDERHLWPEMLRVIRECAPRYVVGENVRGLVSWSKGLVFEEVCADLEAEGYAVQPFLLPACGVGAPHRRDRIWFIAHANDAGGSDRHRQVQGENGKVRQRNDCAQPCNADSEHAPNTDDGSRSQDAVRARRQELAMLSWSEFPTVPPICRGNDGLSKKLDGITFSKWRRESIKAYGNAIVPQVALQIFKAIELYENLQRE
ncbi:MAG: DNA (cytosine-5-)-methyltransferase [Aequorivita sp.]|nr:DNA (cytosine-5-)-methyltransferase [Aequorivita sp.]